MYYFRILFEVVGSTVGFREETDLLGLVWVLVDCYWGV